MKNSDLLAMDHGRRLLTALERQRRFILQQFSNPKACPSCGSLQDWFQARGIAVDNLDLINDTTDDHTFACIDCKRPLRYVLPLIGGWRWAIDHAAEKEAAT